MGRAEVTPAEGAALAALAVRVIGARLLGRPYEPPCPPGRPADLGASFVTIEREGRLRGCVGALDATRPLYLDVARNAVRAMADPRLPAVEAAEWGDLDITVSVLGPREPIPIAGLTRLAGALRPGVDGLVLTDGQHRATFLPAVWRKLPEPARFVAALLIKGGWSVGDDRDLTAERYEVVEFHDTAPRPPLESLFAGETDPGVPEDGTSASPEDETSASPEDAPRTAAGA